MIQIKKINSPLVVQRTCLIEDTQEQDEKYITMKKLGICEEAIKQRMLLDGIKKPVVDCLVFSKAPKPPPLPPPLPPSREHVIKNHQPVQKQSKLSVVANHNPGEGFKAPSLDEILNARTNLKRVNNILNLK